MIATFKKQFFICGVIATVLGKLGTETALLAIVRIATFTVKTAAATVGIVILTVGTMANILTAIQIAIVMIGNAAITV